MSIYSVLSSTVLGANVSGPVFSQASKRATRRGLSTAPALSTLSVRGLANSRDSTDMPRGRSLGSAGASSWRAAVYVSTVMYTYTAGGEICGCDLSPGSTCDPCGELTFVVCPPLCRLVYVLSLQACVAGQTPPEIVLGRVLEALRLIPVGFALAALPALFLKRKRIAWECALGTTPVQSCHVSDLCP